MEDTMLQKLANIATVKNHTQNILNVSRGVIPKPLLHKVQAESVKLDKLFVDLLVGIDPAQAESSLEVADAEYIKRLAEEKVKLQTKGVVKRLNNDKVAVIEAPADEEPKKKTKK